MKKKIYIIAEAGVNHNGNDDFAYKLIDLATNAGANAVKFQTFKAENLVTRFAKKADYQKHGSQANQSQYEMLKKLELSHEMHHKLKEYSEKNSIDFLSTAFDEHSLNFLVNSLELKTLKIPSGDITNGPHLLAHAKTGCNLILSTGMSTMEEIRKALSVLAFGMTGNKKELEQPSNDLFEEAFDSKLGKDLLKKKVKLLHCTSAYPAPLSEINLAAMNTIKDSFGLEVGLSDHSEGIVVPIAASAQGATIIEKHFTLDKSLPGPDHQASLCPDELNEMVSAIRDVEEIMGDGVKKPTISEIRNINAARKSLVSLSKIKEGDILSNDNLGCKRPGEGISPMRYWEIIGTKSKKDLEPDQCL